MIRIPFHRLAVRQQFPRPPFRQQFCPRVRFPFHRIICPRKVIRRRVILRRVKMKYKIQG